MTDDPRLSRWRNILQTEGVDASTLQMEMCDPDSNGDALATVQLGSLVLRFVRDRGGEFLEVKAASVPKEYFSLDELGIAFGWCRPEDTVGDFRSKPRPLEGELAELVRRRMELEVAFSADHWLATTNAIAKARTVRGQIMLKKARGLDPNDFG